MNLCRSAIDPGEAAMLASWLQWLGRGASIGSRGETLAARHLKKAGYKIIARNYTCRIGEIDIIALAPDGRTIVIVEVKSAAGHNEDLPPEVHVNAAKQKKLVSLAAYYVRHHDLLDRPIRFDVIAIDNVAGDQPIIRHHEGAFHSHV